MKNKTMINPLLTNIISNIKPILPLMFRNRSQSGCRVSVAIPDKYCQFLILFFSKKLVRDIFSIFLYIVIATCKTCGLILLGFCRADYSCPPHNRQA